jgi:16S rRNA (uracil1498-N3)-methyltransferase
LGIARVIPLIARRTDSHLAVAALKRVERWRRLAREASEQSRRTTPPLISAPVKLKEAVTGSSGTKIVLAEAGQTKMLREALRPHPGGGVALAVGPEGGWAEAELEMFQGSGWVAASLGATILRAETAAVAAVAVTLSEMQ